ncbi:MAG: protease HtpX [Candidatus Cloacimonadaceae bacterium]|jgi:heat shock protein HtpX|nr:protease HtpX [Candidatus Cloacimonadaceae bacterium]
MQGLKRIGFYLLLNFLVVMMLSVILYFVPMPRSQTLSLLIFCAIFGFAGSFISLALSKFMAKRVYKLQMIDANTPDARARFLYDTVAQMARHEGIAMPEVGIYPSPDVNAFATGASKNKALMAFSVGLLERLSEDEIAAVAGHEMTHIVQGDMVSMTLVMGLVNTFVMFAARIVASVLDSALRGDSGRGGLGYLGYYLVVILLQNVLMLLAMIPVSYYSRYREYRADQGAAELTGAGSMISALQKIEQYYKVDKKQDSFALAKINSKSKTSIFATHPSVADRIERLRSI